MTAAEPETKRVDLAPPCTQCGKPVDLRLPHVTIVIAVQTRPGVRSTTRTHARRVLGTWHKACSRSWPVPLQRHATADEETDHA